MDGSRYVVDLKTWEKGIYFVRIFENDKSYSNKIVIN
jgi:hypothetical protein